MEATGTEEGVWRCSCGDEFETMEGIGGHISRKKNRADHKNMGFGPSLKAVQASSNPAQTSSEAVSESKPKIKDKKPVGEKTGRTTTNIDEASVIVVSPKEFKTSSILLWQAQKVAEIEWNWPKIDYRLGRRPNPSGSRRSPIVRHSAGDPTPS